MKTYDSIDRDFERSDSGSNIIVGGRLVVVNKLAVNVTLRVNLGNGIENNVEAWVLYLDGLSDCSLKLDYIYYYLPSIA